MELVKAQKLALELMETHKLTGFSFGFDRSKDRFGRCNYRSRTITLSKYLVSLNDESEVKDTILHEIAHALVPIGSHHNRVWKAKAKEIGARPERCGSERVIRPSGRYVAVCSHCKKVYNMHRRLQRQYSCTCGGKKFNTNFLLEFKFLG